MIKKLVDGLGAAIGCRFLNKRKQLVFVEYSKGAISLLDMIRATDSILSQGTSVLKGNWAFDCETGAIGASLSGPGDIWWHQIDNIRREMVPIGGAAILNLGKVNFASVTSEFLQALPYDVSGVCPIRGNNDSTNQLTNDDVFAVRTNAGNVTKIRVVQYGYNIKIEWVTYKLASPYHLIGNGYSTPEDIAVSSDEKTAYVTERTGNLLRVDLDNAHRSKAVLVASGMLAPHQIHLDEIRQQAYVVEYANPGRLIRIDLKTSQKTVLLSNLNNAIGLLISPDLAYAYISEQSGGGRISRYSLMNGTRLEIASSLTNPFFLTWANPEKTAMFVAERDPANRITIVETVPRQGSVRVLASGVGARPSSVSYVDAEHLLVCCDKEIDTVNPLEGVVLVSGLFKGIGLVPWNLINDSGMDIGKADTTTQPVYPYQFPKNSPFGGVLSLQINHSLARLSGVKYYRVLVDDVVRLDTWTDLKLNMSNGKYEIPYQFTPKDIGFNPFKVTPGCYSIHQPDEWFMNTDLGMILDSSTLPNGLRTFKIEFLNGAGTLLQLHVQKVLIDNNRCTAAIEMPTVGNNSATTECGMLKFTPDKKQMVAISYTASHPSLLATFSWRLGRAGQGPLNVPPGCIVDGKVSLAPLSFKGEVGLLLGSCPSAAFYAHVYVYAMAINGFGRQNQYDASATIAFALTP